MSFPDRNDLNESNRPGVFATTHWSVVLAARELDSPHARAALEQVCRDYWFPLYAYLRRSDKNPQDAQDLTQEFVARLIAGNDLRGVDPCRGKFRSFLLGTLKHFLSDERKKARAQKRGGGITFVSIDAQTAEQRYHLEPLDALTPEHLFDRQWGLALLDRVMAQLRARYATNGRGELFVAIEPCLAGARTEAGYVDIAARLGTTEGAVKVAVHRLRKEFGERLRAELATTVEDPAELEDEIRHLIQVTASLRA